MLDLGYNLEDIVKVKAAVVDFLTLGQEIKNVLTMCPYLTTMADFLTLGQKINYNPTELRKPLYTNVATQTDFNKP